MTHLILKASGGARRSHRRTSASATRADPAARRSSRPRRTPAPATRTGSTFSASFAVGQHARAVALADGTVNVFKTAGAVTTLVGTGDRCSRSEHRPDRAPDAARMPGSTISGAATSRSPAARPTDRPCTRSAAASPTRPIQAGIDAAAASARRRPRGRLPGHAAGRSDQPAGGLLREPDHQRPRSSSRASGPGGIYPDGTPVTARSSTAAASAATPPGRRLARQVGGLTWVGNQAVFEGQVMYVLAQTTSQVRAQASPRPAHRRLRHPRRRPIRASRATSTRSAAAPTGLPANAETQGGAHLRQCLCPQPPDHEQRRAEQQRRVSARSASERPTCGADTSSTTTTCGSRTTASSPTAARTWPAASASSPGRTTTRSPQRHLRQLLGRVRRRDLSVYGLSPNGTIHRQPHLLQPFLRRGRRDHDRRRAADRPRPRCRRAPAR